MADLTYLDNANPAYVEAMYDQYKADPNSIDINWKKFFDGYEFATGSNDNGHNTPSNKEVAVSKLIGAYRARGHLIAQTNPVRERRVHKADLTLEYFGLSEADLNKEFDAATEIGISKTSLQNILFHLNRTYCASIGVEFMYCRNEELRQWMYKTMEPIGNHPEFSKEDKKHILRKISEGVMFENFLHTKYIGKKRFSLEGLESLIPALDEAIRESANLGAEEFILGMAHRGRLNVLTNIFGKPYEEIFSEFEGTDLPADVKGDGDVKYHLGRSDDIVTKDGKKVHITLAANPSHLEAVNPVVQGMAYAKQEENYDGDVSKVIPILIHGDAAIAGQGVNYETTNISKVPGFAVGGTVHIVTNNQLGFTTSYKEARSSVYCTDLAKVSESPVFHVNADNPEAVVYAVKLAIQIRQKFNIDVYVDILGYRKYGHNEGDEPRFTQPQLYGLIDKHKNVQELYASKLLELNMISSDAYDTIKNEVKNTLQENFDRTKANKKKIQVDYFRRKWAGLRPTNDSDFDESIQTGVSKKDLDAAAKYVYEAPNDIEIVPKMKRILSAREKNYKEEKQVDWAMGELLAYGTLIQEGMGVRLTGQDVQRGTFSHRHAVLRDKNNEENKSYPLRNLAKKPSQFQVYNSILSEYCIMGFEFGYSMSQPHTLTLWEGQFGDFSNGAQIIIDQFLSCSESKWQRFSGLTLLLPHGYEGQGPEHSSARPERYLQLCAENNMYVANPTTPANHFHLLRRQVKNAFRIPLVVLTPKSLLRNPKVVSSISELSNGCFKEIIDDESVDAKKVKRVLLCAGKVYYDLLERQEADGVKDIAIVRLEQLYPLSHKQLDKIKKKYAAAKEWVWVQEESINMGYWSFILRHLRDWNLSVIARRESSSPATGLESEHKETQKRLVDRAFDSKGV